MRVRIPTLPKYISAVIMIFPGTDRFGVTPMVSPTVAKADTSSYSSRTIPSSPSVMHSRKRQTVSRTRAIEKKLKAFCMLSSEILRRKAVASLPRSREKAPFTATKKVVVLIPPPVLPGLAPMNISRIVRTIAGSLSAIWSYEKNPAVLVVADWKKAFFMSMSVVR